MKVVCSLTENKVSLTAKAEFTAPPVFSDSSNKTEVIRLEAVGPTTGEHCLNKAWMFVCLSTSSLVYGTTFVPNS